MKKLLFLISFLTPVLMQAADKNTINETIDIKNITVYLKGAQISGSREIKIPAGQSTLFFTGLPSDIDSKSIRVNAEGNISVFSVNLNKDYLDEKEKSNENRSEQKRRSKTR